MPIELPERIVLLQEAGECSDAYEPDPGGGFRLSAAAREQIDAANAELAAVEKQIADDFAGLDEKLAAKQERIEQLAARRAIGDALDAAGVPVRYVRFAVDRLAGLFDMAVEESAGGEYLVSVRGQFGTETVDAAVLRWLRTDEGALFVGQKRSTTPGAFASAVRDLRLH